MNKLTKKNWSNLARCKRHLIDNGYWPSWTPPELPELWVGKKKNRLAIQREERARSTVWHIVEYPEIEDVHTRSDEDSNPG